MKETGFEEGQRVRIVNSHTAPRWNGKTGVITGSNARYPNRLGVARIVEGSRYILYFYPYELQPAPEKPASSR